MTKKEFKEIEKKFKVEEKYWKKLKVGQSVYESGFEGDFFEIVIEEINVDERYVVGIDKSQKNKKVKLKSFYLIEDIRAQGFN